MEFRLNIKKILLSFLTIVSILIVFPSVYYRYIEEWRVEKSHQHIQKSGIQNFYKNKSNFNEIRKFALKNPEIKSISFTLKKHELQTKIFSTTLIRQLQSFIEKVDCEAIKITENTIHLMYEGISLYNYEYLIIKTGHEIPKNYTQLDKDIYFGLYDSGMFCNSMIFTK